MEHRTNSHAYTVRMKKKNMAATVVVVLLSIILLAGIIVLSPIGDYLMEHAIQPALSAFQKSDQKDTSIVSALKNQEQTASALPLSTPKATPVENRLNVVELPFYILQMGAFTEQDEAQAHAEKIRAMGAAGMVYQDGAVYRVFAAAYRDQSSLEKVQSQVRIDGFEATPFITDQNSVHIILKGDQDAVKSTEDAILLLSKIPEELCDLSLALDKSEIDGDQLAQSLKELLKEIDQTIKAFDNMQQDSVTILRTVFEKYQNRVSTFLKEHDTISKMNAGDFKLLQIECIIDYIQLFERK